MDPGCFSDPAAEEDVSPSTCAAVRMLTRERGMVTVEDVLLSNSSMLSSPLHSFALMCTEETRIIPCVCPFCALCGRVTVDGLCGCAVGVEVVGC